MLESTKTSPELTTKKPLLIAIEGTDGSGKHTQTTLLYERLQRENEQVRALSFPCYDSPSSALVKMYLQGEFGAHPDDVNPYAASSFFAVDRYASYMRDWKKQYKAGWIILTDRYTVSNAIHQGAKLPKPERDAYLKWLYEYEYGRMGIPAPDLVLYLDVPTEITAALRAKRENDNHTKPDIHEQDDAFLRKSRENALDVAAASGWTVIDCCDHDRNKIRSASDIHEEIYAKIRSVLDARQ